MCLLSFVLTGFILFNYPVFCQLEIGKECVTLYNEEGICVYEMDCEPIGEYLQKKINTSISNYAVQYLLDSSCGVFNDKNYICCSNRHTATTTTTAAPETGITTEDVPKFGKIEDVSNHPNLYLLPTSCGILPDIRGSDGRNTSIYEIPFMALLRYETHEGLEFKCAGTIINERYILTSASCVQVDSKKKKAKLVSVRVGEHVISTSRDCELYLGAEFCAPPVEDIDIEEVRRHPWVERLRRGSNNIAVIRLRRAINLENRNMKAICLPINNETQYGTLSRLRTVGWGYRRSGTKSDILLKDILAVIEKDTCQRQYSNSSIFESHICAGDVNNECLGDAGGPVFFIGRVHNTIRNVQYGILVGGSIFCALDKLPNIYTKISHYIKWILDQMRP